MHEIRNYVNIINESWIDDLSIEDLRSLAGRSDNRTSPIINPNNVIVDGNVTLDNIQRTSDSEEFTAVANGFGSSEGSEDYDIDVKDIQVDIKIEAFGSVQEGEFKIVSVTGDGMNFVHEDGNWGDYTDAFVNAMQTEAVEEEKKNCGCGKDPCETYGKTDVEEAMGPMAKVNDKGQIEMTKSDYSKIHRDYRTKIDGTYMALRLDHKTGGTVLTPVTFIDAVAEGEEVRSEEKDTDNMTNSMNEGKVKSQMIRDSETMSKADFIKKYDQENADDLYDKEVEEDTTEKSATETMREYVEKVSATMGDNGANTKSATATPNNMGGSAANLAQGADEKGGKADSAKDMSTGNINVPGGKAAKASTTNAKGHGAEKKGAGETADNKKSVVGK